MNDRRGLRFEREAEVHLGDTDAWGPLGSTITGDSDSGPVPTDSRYARSSIGFEDRYEVLGVLATGRMAEIRLVRDRPFAREIAMKVLRARKPSSRWRFFREARVQGQLSHPAIVPVYDLGLDPSGDVYFTMKWVRGLRFDLAVGEHAGDEPGKTAFTQRQLLARMHQICLALHYAHSRGVVHRDLKPTNVMLGEFGEVYVLDWGLAKVRTEVNPRYEPVDDASGAMRTSDGSVLGTIGFMAPEQLQGEVDVNARADVYSLGAMLFELLAGEPLHKGSAATQALSSLKTDGARPSRSGREIPEPLDALCERALRVKPEDRLDSAAEMADVIEAHLDRG